MTVSRIYLLTFFCLLTTVCIAQKTKKILFIGNSLTFYNDMPQMLQHISDEANAGLLVEQMTFPGVSLARHLTTDDTGHFLRSGEVSPTTKKILSHDWDIVVLQEMPIMLLIPEEAKYAYVPAVVKLDSLIKVSKGQTFLYQNYPLHDYPARYCHKTEAVKMFARRLTDTGARMATKDYCCSDSFYASRDAFTQIENITQDAALRINAKIAPIGYAFEQFKAKYPRYDLYVSDDHPSSLASYMMVCLFYRVFTGNSVSDIKYRGTLYEQSASMVREFVDSLKY